MVRRQDRPDTLHYLAIGVLSAAVLCFEVTLLRLFAFSHWHHFAGFAVSLALLGFGAAGTTLVLLQEKIARNPDAWFCGFLFLSAIGIELVLVLHAFVALRPVFAAWDVRELARLLVIDVAAFLPFFFAGLGIGQAFQRWPLATRRIYSWNLLGSGIGGAMAGVFLAITTVEHVISLLAGLVFLLVAAFTFKRGAVKFFILALATSLAAFGLVVKPPRLAVSDFKQLARTMDLPDAEILETRPGLPGTMRLVRSQSLRFAPGLSLNWTAGVAPRDLVIVGSDRSFPLARDFNGLDREHARASLAGLALELRPAGKVLQLGSSAWQTQALVTQKHALTWVDPDKRLLELAALRGADRFDLHADLPWRFLATTENEFDVIVLDRAYAGGDAVSEDYLLTVETLAVAVGRLAPNGLLAIPLPVEYPPRHYQRVIRSIHAALPAGDNAARLVVLRGLQSLLILIAERRLQAPDRERLQEFAAQWSFDFDWLPGMVRASGDPVHQLASPVFHDITRAVVNHETLPPATRWFHGDAATLNTPYPWRSMRWPKLAEMLQSGGRPALIYLDWTLVLASIATFLVVVLATALILLPLGRLPHAQRPFNRSSVAGYFLALGLAYMLIEMAVFQRLMYFIGEPVLAASLVFTTFLVGSGLGSATAPEVRSRRVVNTLFLGLGVAVLPFTLVSWLQPAWLLAPGLWWRGALIVALLLPLAWAMGRPFPWGLRQLAGVRGWVPWAWGINGFASVAAASAAPLLSVHLGQIATLSVGLASYLTAATLAGYWTRDRAIKGDA